MKYLTLFLLSILILTACTDNNLHNTPADLRIEMMDFELTNVHKSLNIPNGVYHFDNPNLDPNNPDTWTGNVEEFVDYYYTYSILYQIENMGGRMAYDTEVDFYCKQAGGGDKVETVYIGNIGASEIIKSNRTFMSMNQELIDCHCEVFWYY